jgi:two-component system, NtrC family, sensor kinase
MTPANSALPPDASPNADRVSEFRLVRYFTATSLVAFVVVAAVLGYVFRQFSIDGLLDTQEQANVNLTKVFSNDLWRNDFGPFVRAMEGKPAAELKAAPQIPQLHGKVLALMRGSSTFKVKVYDMKGMTVYSTELGQIGEDKSANRGVIAAWQGGTTSELVHRNSFSALEGEVQNRDLIQSYIPQYDPASGKVVGVFEVYSDVTPLLAEIGIKEWYVMGAVFALMALLYAALFLIVNFAQRIMQRQREAHDRVEEALRNGEVELNRSKSEFLSAAAHELRTPMTSIYGFAELLKTRNYDRATTLDIATTIHSESGRLVHLLNELLDLSRIEARAGKAFDFKLQPLIPIIESSVAELLVPGDDRKVQVEIDGDLPHLLLDGDKIKQAMVNILSNAYKYSPAGSRIEVKAFQDGAGGNCRVGILVKDQGIGMSALELRHFFERFWRAEGAKGMQGSGLGMSLVKEIVQFHRGTIDVHSEAGQGTQITVWLPSDDRRTEAAIC